MIPFCTISFDVFQGKIDDKQEKKRVVLSGDAGSQYPSVFDLLEVGMGILGRSGIRHKGSFSGRLYAD